MAGCDEMIIAMTMLTKAKSTPGTSQLATAAGAVFTSSKTSPGVAKTLSNRAARDIACGLGASGFGSGTRGGRDGSINMLAAQPNHSPGIMLEALAVVQPTVRGA